MPFIDPGRLREAANADGEFRLAARYWDAALLLSNGATALRVEVVAGVVTDCREAAPDEPATVSISGDEAGWDEFFAPKPRAFYQDMLGGAIGRHGFAIHGDLLSFAAYYQASQRLFAIIRELRAVPEGAHATL